MEAREFIASRYEMEAILGEEVVGCLGLSVDGKPYVVPLNYAYIEGRILFHCALTGQKLDYLRANPQVCFTVARQSGAVRRHAKEDPCAVDSDSVICYGTARLIEELAERKAALNAFNRSFRPDAEEISLERTSKCSVVEIRISEMTGRRERGQERTCWRHTFQQ